MTKKWIDHKNNKGYTALHYASFRGNIFNINVLIENGGDINVTNSEGINLLHMAAQGNQPNSLIYLIEKYHLNIHNVDMAGSTPLHWACYAGSEEVFNYILSFKNTDLNIRDKLGYTPLHLSVLSGKSL